MGEPLGVRRAVGPLNVVSVLPSAVDATECSFGGGRGDELRDQVDGEGSLLLRDAAAAHEREFMVSKAECSGQGRNRAERDRAEPGMLGERFDGVDDRGCERAPPVAVRRVDENDLAVDLVEDMLEEDVAVREVRVERRCAGLHLLCDVTERDRIDPTFPDQPRCDLHDGVARERGFRRSRAPRYGFSRCWHAEDAIT